jgi:LysR family transcriptional regulator (chromosome initiation inhibitor)
LLEERLGQVLLLRSAPCQATTAGKALARFTEQLALLEAEMMGEIEVNGDSGQTRLRMPIVVNADSLDSWFMNVLADPVLEGVISFDIRMEDQDHSAALLREGTVMAAVSASSDAVQGCLVEPLGVMSYRAVASPAFMRRYFSAGLSASGLAAAPMLVFNRKDGLQHRFIARLSRLAANNVEPPTHFVPSSHGFLEVARRGLAWGMLPEQFVGDALNSGELVEIAPGQVLDVPLFWHRWRLDSHALRLLSAAVHRAARSAFPAT